jgi:hypothetical protein
MRTMKNGLEKWSKSNNIQLPQSKRKRKPKQKKKENLSRQDIQELMGMNRPIYTRGKGGAIRRK